MAKYKNVMIVDDDPVTIIIGERLVKITGFSENVACYTNSVDAFEYLKQQFAVGISGDLTQLIFLDINMPGLSGWDFLDMYNSISATVNPRPLFAVFSSTIDKEDMNKALSYSFVKNFFPKPLKKEHLEIL